MTPESIARYQRIRARILNFQRPVIIKPLTPFQRAVLSVNYPSACR
jgi:hypothetical protein